MQLPSMRFTIRRLMFIVAVAAVALTTVRMYEHWSCCQRRAAYHAQRCALFQQMKGAGIEMCGVVVLNNPSTASGLSVTLINGLSVTLAEGDARGEYVHSIPESIQRHAIMCETYRNAAWRPWLGIEADLPPREP
jgi:hypothetical protein